MSVMQDVFGVSLNSWFAKACGQVILEAERACCRSLLDQVFGYHALQIGYTGLQDYLGESLIVHRIGLQHPLVKSSTLSLLSAHYDSLPFASDSMDLICIPHVLEEVDAPAVLLAEAIRVLIPQGYLLIIGFNPKSLWRVFQFLGAACLPKGSTLWSMRQLKYWLEAFDCEVIQVRREFFGPPSCAKAEWQNSAWQKLGLRYWPNCGAIYAILARKRAIMVTPLQWRQQKSLVEETLPRPANWGEQC